ncbi:MAG TPA: DUF3048 domain-containing protein [Propionibacteriaceae bacterium]
MSSFVWKRGHTIVAAVVGVALVGGGIGLASARNAPDQPGTAPNASATATSAAPQPSATPSPTAKPKPTNPLTGGKVSGNKVLAVKVENIGLARPQVGLHAADIVFAEEVEGAQTRLIAIYHTRFPTAVEPVRSARSTDVQLLPLFGKPGLVYSGANRSVQRKIDGSPIVPIYRETRDPRRIAPHNVRVNLKKLAATEKAGKAQSIGWTFATKDDQVSAAKKAGEVKTKVGHDTFGFTYTGGRYTVRWNGKTYVDGDNSTVTKTDNVIVMDVVNHPDGNRDVAGSASVMSDTKGSGKVAIYRDGKVLKGTWDRENRSSKLRFRDAEGHDIPLKPGQTWVALHG